jgi:hypothetical protein
MVLIFLGAPFPSESLFWSLNQERAVWREKLAAEVEGVRAACWRNRSSWSVRLYYEGIRGVQSKTYVVQPGQGDPVRPFPSLPAFRINDRTIGDCNRTQVKVVIENSFRFNVEAFPLLYSLVIKNSPVSSLMLTRPSVRLRMSCSARSTVRNDMVAFSRV